MPCFAQTNQPASARINQLALLEAFIDHTNDVGYDIYLTSPDSARNLAEKALLLSEKIKYSLGIARSYSNIGVIYWSQSYYPIALFYLNTALANVPKGQPLLLSDIYSNIGRVYADLNDYKKAIYNLNKSEILAGTDKLHLGEALSEKSYIYLKLKNYAKAIDFAKKSLKLDQSVGEQMGAAIDYSRIGDIYYAEKDYARGLAYDDTAYRNSVKLHMNRLRAGMYLQYAIINATKGNYDIAIEFAKKGVKLYNSIGIMIGLSKTYKSLIESFEAKKDLKNALYYERQYNHIEDSLNTADKMRSTQLIQNYFALNARLDGLALVEKRNEDNKGKIKFQHTIINMLLVSLLFVIAALTVTFYYYKQKKLLSKKLQQQKRLIEAQAANLEVVNNLKDKMLAVVGHDLRTPIANLINISSLFESDDLTVTEVNSLMRDINPIVKGAELTLSNLLDWAGSQIKGRSVVPTNIDIHLLGAEMEQTFKHLLNLKNIEFKNQVQAGELAFADENQVKVILRNLISNAIKFTEVNGHVFLSTGITAGKLIISVTDDGKGISSGEIDKLFHPGTHFSHFGNSGEQGTGLGLLLCKELVELNGGQLKVTSETGKGSRFYFDLPLVK